jgi:hypothetical protein
MGREKVFRCAAPSLSYWSAAGRGRNEYSMHNNTKYEKKRRKTDSFTYRIP